MKLPPQDRVTPPPPTFGEPPHDEVTECPEVVTHGDRRVLFGPGLDDFNAFDDPC